MDLYDDAVQRLCKWRNVFVSWQLGTRLKEDPVACAVRDHREVTILLRAEVSALTAMLVRKGVFTVDEFRQQLAEESEHLNKAYEQKFPGFTAELDGIHMQLPEAAATLRTFPP